MDITATLTLSGWRCNVCKIRASGKCWSAETKLWKWKHVTASECGQTQTKTIKWWVGQSCRLYTPGVLVTVMKMHSFSSRIFAKFGSRSYKTTPETLADSHCSLGMRPRQDHTLRVVLNNHVSTHWSPMCHYLALTSLRDNYSIRLQTPQSWVSKALDIDRQLFFSLLYSVSVLLFPYFSFCTSAFSTSPESYEFDRCDGKGSPTDTNLSTFSCP